MFQRLLFPRFTEPRPVSASSSHYLQSKYEDSMDNEISESGWTTYLEQSLDSWSIKNSSEFDILQQYREASSITGNDEDSSMVSDASSGPQKLPLPLPLLSPVHDRHGFAGSYSSVSTRKRNDHVNEREDSECVASCSSLNVNPRKKKFRKLNTNEHSDLLLQDTASSSLRQNPDSGLVESDVNIEKNLQLPAENVGDIEVDNPPTWDIKELSTYLYDGMDRIKKINGDMNPRILTVADIHCRIECTNIGNMKLA